MNVAAVFKQHMLKASLIIAVFFYVLVTFSVISKVPVTMDEVLFSEPARNFIEEGRFGTTSMSGLFDFENKTYWQHPLYIALMYLPLKIFGYNCWSIRFISAAAGLASLALAYRIGKKYGVPHLFPILLVFNVLYIFAARLGRMEMLSLCLSLASFCFSKERKPVLAGVVSSLAVLTHPIGVFTCINSLILLKQSGCLNKKFFISLAVPLLIAFSFVIGDWSEFMRQYFTVQKYLYENSGWWGGPLTQVKNFLKLLVEAKQWLFWLVPLFILSIIGLVHKQDEDGKSMLLIQVINFLGLVFLIPNKYINYYVALVLPYTALYAAYSIKKRRTPLTIAVLAILLCANALGIAKNNIYFMQNSPTAISLKSMVKPNSKVLAQPCMAAYLDNCKVVGFHNVRLIMDLEKKSVHDAFQDIAPDYLIIDDEIARIEGWPLFTKSQDELGEFVAKHTLFQGSTMLQGSKVYVFKFTQ